MVSAGGAAAAGGAAPASTAHQGANAATTTTSTEPILLGVAARDRKARSKPMSQILNRILSNPDIECQIVNFGDKVLLDEPPESWPVVDVLISFFSDGFPLDKAIAYVDLRKPVLVNDLRLQKILWDRRAVLAILDAVKVPTPRRVEVDRDGGPLVEERVLTDLKKRLQLDLLSGRKPAAVECYIKTDDVDTLVITKTDGDGKKVTMTMKKPFVEKPVSGEDHNIHIYFPTSRGGGGRRLFRKVGNKSSEYDAELVHPRTDGSYIYEEFMDVDNAEDVKVYTIGPNFVHAETRKSPVVDGMVKRNPDGKEIRYITKLTDDEKAMATNISNAFKQNICGFDLLRAGKKSYVIDVNGWSFVKGNDFYYDKCAEILSKFCKANAPRRSLLDVKGLAPPRGGDQEQSSWTLKANVTVFRHGDRTPKQKLKRSYKPKDKWTAPLLDLLQGRREEIILRSNLDIISKAAQKAMEIEGANIEDLKLVIQLIERKKDFGGTKVQIKPHFDKTTGDLEKMQLIIKWGGEFSHAARHQAKDFGQNMRRDMIIMNDAALKNCTIYTSSERRVTASAEIFAAAFLEDKAEHRRASEPLELIIRKDLLDDSNAAKDWMDIVKKDLKRTLRPEVGGNDKPDGWPEDLDGPAMLCSQVAALLLELRDRMRSNWSKLDVNRVQARWCTHETPALFRERWEKLFADYEEDPHDPGRTSELYDMLCHDGLHNRPFLETIFTDPNDKTDNRLAKMQQLYRMSMALFNFVCPREYGITPDQKARIGLLTSMPLLDHIVENLKASEKSSLCALYFTKESHIHTLLNLILASDLPIVMPSIPPLDYFSSITFEVFEKTVAPGSSSTATSPRSSTMLTSGVGQPPHDNGGHGEGGSAQTPSTHSSSKANSVNESGPMRSLLISLSEGAHSSNILSVNLDARHALTPLPRRPLTTHMNFDESLAKLGAHAKSITNLDAPIERGQIEGGAVFFGEQMSETGVLPVKQRRSSTDTDQTQVL